MLWVGCQEAQRLLRTARRFLKKENEIQHGLALPPLDLFKEYESDSKWYWCFCDHSGTIHYNHNIESTYWLSTNEWTNKQVVLQ